MRSAPRSFQPGPEHVALFACGVLLAGYVVLLAMAAGKGTWLVDLHGRPAPSDFNGLWAAAKLSADGRAADAYGWPALHAVLTGAGRPGEGDWRFPFFYPPVLLMWLRPLGLLPYAAAAVAWVVGSLLAYAAALRMVSGRALPLVAGLAAPAVLACVYVGQNGLLTAALAGAAFALLPKRPALAGVLIGLIAYKPQFGAALPLLLIAGGRWRTIAAAAATVVVTYGLAGLVLGWDVYAACLQQLIPHEGVLPAIGGLPPAKLQSVYGLAVALGLPSRAAWAAHLAVAGVAVGAGALVWKRAAAWPLQAAAAVCVMLIASPYSVLYDFPLLSVAIAWLLRDGECNRLSGTEVGALVAAFAAPFAAAALGLPLCPIGAVVALAVAARRAMRRITKVSSPLPHPNAAPLAS